MRFSLILTYQRLHLLFLFGLFLLKKKSGLVEACYQNLIPLYDEGNKRYVNCNLWDSSEKCPVRANCQLASRAWVHTIGFDIHTVHYLCCVNGSHQEPVINTVQDRTEYLLKKVAEIPRTTNAPFPTPKSFPFVDNVVRPDPEDWYGGYVPSGHTRGGPNPDPLPSPLPRPMPRPNPVPWPVSKPNLVPAPAPMPKPNPFPKPVMPKPDPLPIVKPMPQPMPYPKPMPPIPPPPLFPQPRPEIPNPPTFPLPPQPPPRPEVPQPPSFPQPNPEVPEPPTFPQPRPGVPQPPTFPQPRPEVPEPPVFPFQPQPPTRPMPHPPNFPVRQPQPPPIPQPPPFILPSSPFPVQPPPTQPPPISPPFPPFTQPPIVRPQPPTFPPLPPIQPTPRPPLPPTVRPPTVPRTIVPPRTPPYVPGTAPMITPGETKLSPLLFGEVTNKSADGLYRYTGSVTLVQDDGFNILIDSGSAVGRLFLVAALAAKSLKPQNVHILLITHAHPDHVGNENVFPNAEKLFASALYKGDEYMEPDVLKEPVIRLTKNVEVWKTPGHTLQHNSVIVRNATGLGTVAVAGDLFLSREDFSNPALWRDRAVDANLQDLSRNLIICQVEKILPGHGLMFEVTPDIRQRANCGGARKTRTFTRHARARIRSLG